MPHHRSKTPKPENDAEEQEEHPRKKNATRSKIKNKPGDQGESVVEGENPNEAKELPGLKNNTAKKEAFSLPEVEYPEALKNRPKPKRVTPVMEDRNSIFKEERMRLYKKTSLEIELEEQDVADLVEHELKILEHKKLNKWMHYFHMVAAKADVFATAHTMPKHQVCIFVAFAMIPLSILTITWDLLAIEVFQIPHLSTISAPAFILYINFVAMPLAMYGYMMEYLMYENSREAILGVICVVIHPILFLTRAFMEFYFDGFRAETKLYFENAEQGEHIEYPVGALTSLGPLKLI